MFRIRLAAVLATVACLASATVATAASEKRPDGGQATVALSPGFASALGSAGVTVSPTAGARRVGSSSSAGASFAFPVKGGLLRSDPYTGVAYTRGALGFHKGGASATVTHLVVVLNRNGSLDLMTQRRVGRKRVCSPIYEQHRDLCVEQGIYKLVPVAHAPTVSPTNGTTVTGTLDVTTYSARLIDRLAGRAAVSAGETLGTVTFSPTLGSTRVTPPRS